MAFGDDDQRRAADAEGGWLLTMNLEEYRNAQGWSYAELAAFLDVPQAKTVRAYAIGAQSPSAERLQAIVDRTNGAVSVLEMHNQRLAYIRQNGGTRASAPMNCDNGGSKSAAV